MCALWLQRWPGQRPGAGAKRVKRTVESLLQVIVQLAPRVERNELDRMLRSVCCSASSSNSQPPGGVLPLFVVCSETVETMQRTIVLREATVQLAQRADLRRAVIRFKIGNIERRDRWRDNSCCAFFKKFCYALLSSSRGRHCTHCCAARVFRRHNAIAKGGQRCVERCARHGRVNQEWSATAKEVESGGGVSLFDTQ
jgi:hypothetical protein